MRLRLYSTQVVVEVEDWVELGNNKDILTKFNKSQQKLIKVNKG